MNPMGIAGPAVLVLTHLVGLLFAFHRPEFYEASGSRGGAVVLSSNDSQGSDGHYNSWQIDLIFNAKSKDGVLLFGWSPTAHRDFILLSLVNKHVHFLFRHTGEDERNGSSEMSHMSLEDPVQLNTWYQLSVSGDTNSSIGIISLENPKFSNDIVSAENYTLPYASFPHIDDFYLGGSILRHATFIWNELESEHSTKFSRENFTGSFNFMETRFDSKLTVYLNDESAYHFSNYDIHLSYFGNVRELSFDLCGGVACDSGYVCKMEVWGTGYQFHCRECEKARCPDGSPCRTFGSSRLCVCSEGAYHDSRYCSTHSSLLCTLCGERGVCNDEDACSCQYPFIGENCASCLSGWRGDECSVDVDECASDPCVHGTCVDEMDSFFCTCDGGFNGFSCEDDEDSCFSNPCVFGTCIDGPNNYTCICDAGYAGELCQNQTDECASSPCNETGICTDMLNGFECACAVGWTGTTCSEDILECVSDPCTGNFTCEDLTDGYLCACPDGYSGEACQNETDECLSDPCRNGSTCLDEVNGYTCDCAPGYTAPNCDVDINECIVINSTDNETIVPMCVHGECVNTDGGFMCSCSNGFEGDRCERQACPCFQGVCLELTPDGFNCSCAEGWWGDFCNETDQVCTPSSCVHGTCDSLDGVITCECDPGYAGLKCNENINECLSNPCAQGHCVDGVNSYKCENFTDSSGDYKLICVRNNCKVKSGVKKMTEPIIYSVVTCSECKAVPPCLTWHVIHENAEVQFEAARVSANHSTLYIPGGTLKKPGMYVVQAAIKQGTAIMLLGVTFEIVPAPDGGVCSVTPEEGVEIVTAFVVSCEDWVGAPPQLTYRLYHVMDNLPAALLGEQKGNESSFSVNLPFSGSGGNYDAMLLCKVMDKYGQSVMVEIPVTVKPNTFVLIDLLNLYLKSGSSSASFAEYEKVMRVYENNRNMLSPEDEKKLLDNAIAKVTASPLKNLDQAHAKFSLTKVIATTAPSTLTNVHVESLVTNTKKVVAFLNDKMTGLDMNDGVVSDKVAIDSVFSLAKFIRRVSESPDATVTKTESSQHNQEVTKLVEDLIEVHLSTMRLGDSPFASDMDGLSVRAGKVQGVELDDMPLTTSSGTISFLDMAAEDKIKLENSCVGMKLAVYDEKTSMYWSDASDNAELIGSVADFNVLECTSDAATREKRDAEPLPDRLAGLYLVDVRKPKVQGEGASVTQEIEASDQLSFQTIKLPGRESNLHVKIIPSSTSECLDVYIGINFTPSRENYSLYYSPNRKDDDDHVTVTQKELEVLKAQSLIIGVGLNCSQVESKCAACEAAPVNISYTYIVGAFSCSHWYRDENKWQPLGGCKILAETPEFITFQPGKYGPVAAQFGNIQNTRTLNLEMGDNVGGSASALTASMSLIMLSFLFYIFF